MNKKGQMGLGVANSFVVGLLSLVVVGVLAMITLTQLEDTTLIEADTYTGSVTNETGAYINSTGYTLDKTSERGFSSPALTALYNYTDGTTIGLGNATLSSDGVMTNATATTWDNVSVSYTYNYERDSDTQTVVTNATSGLNDFFSNTTVWLSLLGVVIIILIIAAVVGVVNRFGQDSQMISI